MSLNVWQYLFEIKSKGVFKNKQRRVLSHVAIYTEGLKVYKVVVFADTFKKHKWQKYGVSDEATIITPTNNPKNISFPTLTNSLKGSEIGRKLFIYSFSNDDIKCFDGEETTPTLSL